MNLGESILFCEEKDRRRVEELVKSELSPVKSCLIQGNGETPCASMKRAILEVIVSGVAGTPELVEKYASCTLLEQSIRETMDEEGISASQEITGNSIKSCVKFLEENEFIRLQPVDKTDNNLGLRYVATQLGLACLASSLSPDEALAVFTDLQKARRCFVLESELHVIYQVVPFYAAQRWEDLAWNNYLDLWAALPGDMQRVGDLVGVEERFMLRCFRGTVNKQVESYVSNKSL